MSTVLLVILIVVLLGGVGTYPGVGVPHSYGYYPAGGFGLIFIILLVLLLTGRI